MTLVLTHNQRALLFAGQVPAIVGDHPCPVEPGYVYRLSKRMELEVLDVRERKKGGWSLRYIVRDRRDPVRLLRRTPAIHGEDYQAIRDSFDECGYPLPPDAADIAAASEESSYTGARSTLSDAGEAVPVDWIDPGAEERMKRHRETRSEEELRKQAKSLGRRVREETIATGRAGVDVSLELAAIELQLEEIKRKRRDAA